MTAIDQVVLADQLGIDNVWAVEHHFLEEYSHSSAPEVFLAACAARTERIRIGHGIKHTPANYNHPSSGRRRGRNTRPDLTRQGQSSVSAKAPLEWNLAVSTSPPGRNGR